MLAMEKVDGMMLNESSEIGSAVTAMVFFRRLDCGLALGSWALVVTAKRSSNPNSSIRLKSFNSKGFSRIVKMQHLNV
jgi:hypothetical protein